MSCDKIIYLFHTLIYYGITQAPGTNILLIIFPIVFALSGIGIFIITNRSLKALNIFSGKIGQITEKSLNQRVESQNIETELRPLAQSFNTMLGRIEDAFTKQKQFLLIKQSFRYTFSKIYLKVK